MTAVESSYGSYIGREQSVTELIAERPIRRLAALLDHLDPPWREGEVPPLGHWLYFLPDAVQSKIGRDGHPELGTAIPDFGRRRRMWAGSRIEFRLPLPIGITATRRSRIADIREKRGRTGSMVFVTFVHELAAGGSICIREEQDVVYRAPAPKDGPIPALPAAPDGQPDDLLRTFEPDSIAMFRFSALTFNAHRIHYDTEYARAIEGYPNLVIQGPLVAMYIVDTFLRTRPRTDITRFSFRVMQPMYLGDSLTVHLRGVGSDTRVWVTKQDGSMTVEGEITTQT